MVSLLKLAEITEEGVAFQSPHDGSNMLLTPEKSIEIQNSIGKLLHCMLASGAVYCNRSCLCVCGGRAGGQCLWRVGGVCYHDNSKLHASIFTKLGL